MQHKRHLALANTPKHSFEPPMMISMPMREHDSAQITCLHFEYIHIMQNRIPSQSGVIEHRLTATITLHRQ